MSDERLGKSSASGFATDVLCYGRRNLIRSLIAAGDIQPDDDAPSEAAERGTRIHRALELDQAFNLASDEIDAYNIAVKMKNQLLAQWVEDNDIKWLKEMPREQRLWLHHPETLAPLLSGQQDAHWQSLDGAHIACLDYKTGRAEHMDNAPVNWQLRLAALLTWIEYDRRATKIRVAFVKPEAFGEPVDYADFTQFDLEQIERATYHHLWQIEQPDAPLHAGEHCRWCPAKSGCPAALRYAMSPVPALAVVSTNGKLTKKDVAAIVETAPIEAVREVFGKRGVIKFILDAVAARLASLPPEEHYRLALKLNLGRSGDYVKDVRGAVAALIAGGFPENEVWGCLSLSKTEVVEMVQRYRNCRDSEAEVWYESQLDDYIERSRGAPILAEA